MPELKQAGRTLSIKTPLGDDKLVIKSFTMKDNISGLFRASVAMLSEDKGIKPEAIIGQKVTIRIVTSGDAKKQQYVNGFVSSFALGGKDDRGRTYFAEVVPWLWFLTQTADSRIFQKKSVPDIIQQIFKDLGFTDFKLQLQGTFEPRDYCVQYRETDFAFVSRLMEEEGIFYFFEHSQDKHTLVLGNHPGAHNPAAGFDKYRYVPKGGEGDDEGGVESWRNSQSLRSGKYALNDYEFLAPQNSLLVTAPSAIKVGGNDKFEVYDWDGGYAKRFDGSGDDKVAKIKPDGERTVKLRMQAVEASGFEITGDSSRCGLCSGCKFDLAEHEDGAQNGTYVITSVQHAAQQNPYASGAGQQSYTSTFTCIPLKIPFRPQRTTPKPVIHGVQTAVVVGLSGEEIDCDKYGRVRVQFHWDREGKKDQNSSCWVRVATMWAGSKFGMMHLPRIEEEVIVAFLEGDPDQPIIVGSVYNALNMPPYDLPDNKTVTGFKTRSSKKGEAETANEFYFDDNKGKELVYLRAQKELKTAVEEDEINWVGHDRWTEVQNKETLIVYDDDRETTLEKGNDKHQLKKGNREVLLDMGNDTLTIKMGNQTTKLDLGKSATEALQSIELKVGQSSLKVDQTGVTIKGMTINIEGQILTKVTGLMTNVKADAILKVGGGLTMIG